MRARITFLALLCSASVMAAGVSPPGGKPQPITTSGGDSPLMLPLVQESDLPGMFTFLGSFKTPNQTGCTGTNLYNVSGGISAVGSTMYVAANFYNPYHPTMDPAVLAAQGSITMPTITPGSGSWATPQYDGTNGCATVNWGPSTAANLTDPADYSFTATPSVGATSATFVSAPPGIAPKTSANPLNWFIRFGTTEDHAVTAVSGNNVTWSGGCTACSSSVKVYQWEPLFPYGYASGGHVTGSMAYGGKFYQTGVAYYDAGCTLNKGWITSANLDGTGWSSVNTVTNYPPGLSGGGAIASRNYAGQLSQVPAIWQSLLGGPAFLMSGLGAISNIGCNVPYGFNLTTFDPATATGGVAVRVNTLIDYLSQGSTTDTVATSITGRVLTGPFPLCVAASACESGYFPATLTAAPSGGATTATFVLPSSAVHVTANVVNQSNNLVITSIDSGGPISGSGIYYTASDTAGCVTNIGLWPSYEAGPTQPVGPGTYTLHTVAKCTANGDTVTLTPQGYFSGYYTIIFTDLGGGTESRIVHLTQGSASIPNATAGTNDPTTFAIQGAQSLTANQPLVCNGGCSASVQVAPMGDQYASIYDGPFGTGFIVSGTRTLLMISQHEFGPAGPRADPCKSGASGTNEMPLTPDTGFYDYIQVTPYDMDQVVGATNVWTPTPYGAWPFPGESVLHAANGCLDSASPSWAYYDPTTSRLYMIFSEGAFATGAQGIVYVWQVNAISALIKPRSYFAANDDRYEVAA